MWNPTANQIRLTLIRHGQTAGNLKKAYIGSTDEPLTESAKEWLAKAAEEANKYPPADLLFTSPMKRCMETAALIYPRQESISIEKLREMNFGQFEGKNYQELNGNSDYQAWIDSGATLAFPGGESRAEFVERTKEGFGELLEHVLLASSDAECKVTAVVHGGTIMALLSSFSEGDYFDFQVPNGEGYRCLVTIPSPSSASMEDFHVDLAQITISEIERL